MQRPGLITLGLLLAALAAVLWLDPRSPNYRSTYDPDAHASDLRRWEEDLERWYESPRYRRFDTAVAHMRGVPPPQSPWPEPDFAASYVFGKYEYRLDVQIRGERIHYISWGNDLQQDIGGAWFAVGEGKRRPDGRWFSVWSCLDLTRLVSNGGGAFFEFSPDRRRIAVSYYHDTLPFGETAMERGEAVMWPRKGPEASRVLEGRIQTYAPTLSAPEETPFVLWGRVVDERGEGVAGAAVKRRAAGAIEATTDARGFFKLSLPRIEQLTLISAGKLGYSNGTVVLEQQTAFRAIGPSRHDAALATIELRTMDRTDHRDYEFVAPGPSRARSPAEQLQCANCHTRAHTEWRLSRHATMARNLWVRAAFDRDARPSAQAAGRGRDECTPCHSPSLAATLDRFELSGKTLLDAHGVHLDGNHCDFCHKIEAVMAPHRPGLDGSIRLLRPNPHDDTWPGAVKRVFGPLPDVTYLYMGAAYNPLFQTGVLCAGCHEHTLDNGIVGQGTYSEWSRTKYARPGADYKECQSCHMPNYRRGELITNTDADGQPRETVTGDISVDEYKHNGMEIARSGTRYRPLSEAHKHTFIGTDDAGFLREGVSMTARAEPLMFSPNFVRLSVTLENVGAGHAIPTGHGLKRLLLVVEGGVGRDVEKTLEDNDRVMEASRAHSGLVIGRKFAGSSLEDALSGGTRGSEGWQIPYWRASRQVADNRLWPGKPRHFSFTLPAPAAGYTVKLILRRGEPGLLRAHAPVGQGEDVSGAPLDRVIHVWTAR